MSLLADLLSKKNSAGPSGRRDIPPTLIRAHGTPIAVRNFKKRYIFIAVVSMLAISAGVFAMSQFWQITPVSPTKQAIVAQQVKPPETTAPVATAPPVPIMSPVTAPAPAPVVAAAPIIQEKPATKHPRQKSPEVNPVTQRLEAFQSAKRTAAKKPMATEAPEPEAAPANSVDTVKRDSLLYAARTAELAGNWNLALTIYRKALKIDPENYKIMSNSAAALNNLGMYEEGGKEAKQALGKKPDYVPAMINAAIAYSSTGKSQDALDLFSKASAADPSNRSLAINFGILQERSGKLEDAQKTYRNLADDGDPLALNGLGRIHERTGNKMEAARVYRQILSLPTASNAIKKEVKLKLSRLGE
jgi:Flp pilus assembly protein TadD